MPITGQFVHPNCHYAASIPPLYYFLHLLGQIATSPSFVSLNAQRLFFPQVHYVTESIGFPCATIRDRDPSCASRFSEAVCAQTHRSNPHTRIVFASRIVATRLMRLYLHAHLSQEMKHTEKCGSPLRTARYTRYVCIRDTCAAIYRD